VRGDAGQCVLRRTRRQFDHVKPHGNLRCDRSAPYDLWSAADFDVDQCLPRGRRQSTLTGTASLEDSRDRPRSPWRLGPPRRRSAGEHSEAPGNALLPPVERVRDHPGRRPGCPDRSWCLHIDRLPDQDAKVVAALTRVAMPSRRCPDQRGGLPRTERRTTHVPTTATAIPAAPDHQRPAMSRSREASPPTNSPMTPVRAGSQSTRSRPQRCVTNAGAAMTRTSSIALRRPLRWSRRRP
jgi:hypothetical protein